MYARKHQGTNNLWLAFGFPVKQHLESVKGKNPEISSKEHFNFDKSVLPTDMHFFQLPSQTEVTVDSAVEYHPICKTGVNKMSRQKGKSKCKRKIFIP